MTGTRNLKMWLTMCCLMLVVVSAAGAATHYVNPGDSIQAAINAAVSGVDQIEVAPGTYNEAINFHGKAIRLYSSGGPGATTINGNGAYHVVKCMTGETSKTILEGFTITGGNANGTDLDSGGGGMINNGSPTVKNCAFTGNLATSGGGMYNEYGNPTVTNCTFYGNRTYAGAKGADGGYEQGEDGGNGVAGGNGAGMYNDHSSPTITNCYFVNNQTGDGGSGGDGSGGVIRPGRGGDAENGGHGAGMYNDQCSPKVRGCTFSNNITGNGGNGGEGGNDVMSGGKGKGGGVGAGVCNVNSSPEFVSCSFTGNKTGRGGRRGYPCGGAESDPGGDGAGMYSSGCSPLVVIDCSFTGNETGEGGPGGRHNGSGGRGGYGAGMLNYIGDATVTNCTFAGNETGKGGNGRGGPTGSIYHPSGGLGGCGAGMYNSGGSVTVSNCTFGGNVTGPGGLGRDGLTAINLTESGGHGAHGGNGGEGAGMHNRGCNPVVTHCSFLGNATGDGGDGGNGGLSLFGKGGDGGNGGNGGFGAAMYNDGCSPTLNDCAFIENVAGSRGTRGSYGDGWEDGSRGQWGLPGTAGMANLSSSPTVTNCTFHDNSSDNGGGLYNSNSNPIVTNCILWDITSTEIYNNSSTPVVTFSDVKGGTGQSWFGEGCIDIYPMFASAHGRLLPGSSCIDAGSTIAVPADIQTDLDGNPRIMDGDLNGVLVVDMGAYETPGTLCVPDNYLTIQAAIDAAPSALSQIQVAPGTYNEAINFKGKAIRLYGRDGPAVTTINGNGAQHVVQCVSGEGSDTILEGFTITGGKGDIGAGMFNDNNSSPTVTNCTFSGNKAYLYGGGMFNHQSSPTVTNCTFSSNKADDSGGGMYNWYSTPTVTNCAFTSNTGTSRGGGMYNWYSTPTVTNCTFTSNTGIRGVGMYNLESNPAVTNCTLSGNTGTQGGGMYNSYSNPTVTNCTFSGNKAYANGGGIYSVSASNPTVTNCIFWGNSAPSGSQIYGAATVTYSNVQGGWTGTGNINANPVFADGAGRLSRGSPCIDTGNNSAVSGVATDLDGKPRITAGNLDGVPVVDMGAYEYVSVDADADGIEDGVDTAPLVHSNDFADGSTTGTIIDRADQLLVIADAPAPHDVSIEASASGGPKPAQVSICGGGVLTLGAGDVALVTCGSIEITVVHGTVEIVFTAIDGTQAQTTLNAGNAIAFDPETCTITAPTTNVDNVVVIVNGGQIVLAPGESKTLAQVVDIDIYPNRTPNQVFLSRNYTLYVAVLGSADFDVTTLSSATVKFGKTGTEASPLRTPLMRDLNYDSFIDAMYGFRTFDCGFALGDTKGWLKGTTTSGIPVEGSDSVVVSP